MLKEFKEFAMRGNVIDMAVGIIAFSVFLIIKQINLFKRKEAAGPASPTTKDCPCCFSVIPLKASRCPQCTSELKA